MLSICQRAQMSATSSSSSCPLNCPCVPGIRALACPPVHAGSSHGLTRAAAGTREESGGPHSCGMPFGSVSSILLRNRNVFPSKQGLRSANCAREGIVCRRENKKCDILTIKFSPHVTMWDVCICIVYLVHAIDAVFLDFYALLEWRKKNLLLIFSMKINWIIYIIHI